MQRRITPWPGLIALLLAGSVMAQSLYKYRGPDGEWIFTDRQPATTEGVEVRDLPVSAGSGNVTLTRHTANGRASLLASNSLYAPVQLMLLPAAGRPAAAPQEWLLPPLSETELRSFEVGTDEAASGLDFRYLWFPGDPASQHFPETAYRAPYPAAVSHPVSQAWPDQRTHTTPDSIHAVDIAMPVGSDVHAARAGVVVEVASTNFRSSDSLDGEGGSGANIVRILHDDGTFAIYAHLNWNSIRVRPGQRVERGQYIADSGNTGFSSGPHLHFVVVRNAGMRFESVAVEFAISADKAVVPTTGMLLTAH